MSKRLGFLLARAPVFITTATPVLLFLVLQLLTWLGAIDVHVGWQSQAVAYGLFFGRFVREGLASGGFVKEARTAYAIWRQLESGGTVFAAPLPSDPVVPGIITPLGPPPGIREDARGY